MINQTVITVLQGTEIYTAVGVFGSLVELVGTRAKLPKVENVGKVLEAIALDAPKVLSNITTCVVAVLNLVKALGTGAGK